MEPFEPLGSPVAREIEAMFRHANARARIASSLYDMLRDVLDPSILARGCPDQPALEAVLPAALNAAVDQALATLAAGIASAFDPCSEVDLERLSMGRRWRELGWD